MAEMPRPSKTEPANQAQENKNKKPAASEELSNEALDKAVGGLIPAVSPQH